jgi:hypothetical protein
LRWKARSYRNGKNKYTDWKEKTEQGITQEGFKGINREF